MKKHKKEYVFSLTKRIKREEYWLLHCEKQKKINKFSMTIANNGKSITLDDFDCDHIEALFEFLQKAKDYLENYDFDNAIKLKRKNNGDVDVKETLNGLSLIDLIRMRVG